MSQGKGLKVIIVEDDPTLLSFWSRIMEDVGCDEALLLSNAAGAARVLDEMPVDLLISDIVMPKRSGYELLKLAHARNPQCKILLTTGYAADLSRFELAGFSFHLLHKPYADIAALRSLIASLLRGTENLDEISEESSSENEDYPNITEWKL